MSGDIFKMAFLAGAFQDALEKKAQTNPDLFTAFQKAATPQEIEEITRIINILEKRIPNHEGGNTDAVQAPRAALLVKEVDFFAAIALRIMEEKDLVALIPKEDRTQAISDDFTSNGANNLAKLFKPSGP